MRNEIRDVLENRILDMDSELDSLEVGSDGYSKTVSDMKKIADILLDDDKFILAKETEKDEITYKYDDIATKERIAEEQRKSEAKDRRNRIIMDTVGIVVPLTAEAGLLLVGMCFERTGSFSMTTLRNVVSSLRIKKK